MHHDFAQLFARSHWLMKPKVFRALFDSAQAATPEAIQAAQVAFGQRQIAPTMIGDIALIDACGPITYKSSWMSYFFGGASIEDLQTQLRAALVDPAVRTIAFRWDSPGGCVEMVQEFADEVYAARGAKPILSLADTLICSAAYWIAAQTNTIYASPSSYLGSIGVWTEHDDISAMLEKVGVKVTLIYHGAHKVDGNPYEPLSSEVEADIQADIDAIGNDFEAAVARGRGVSKKVVVDTFGQGKAFRGTKAIALGLADKAGTFSQVLGKLTKGRGARAMPAQLPVQAAMSQAKKADDEPVEPVDGECDEGYELGDDGLCHLIPDEDPEPEDDQAAARTREAQAAADRDALAIAAALAE